MQIKVVTFNLRMDTTGDGKNYFFNRAPYILQKITKESPDIICFQEATDRILPWLKSSLWQYNIVGTGRDSKLQGEANPIAYKKDKFDLFGLDQFWLSPTPHVPGSRHEGQSDCPRICTVATLREIGSAHLMRFYNTHLDHVGANARLLGIRSILERITLDNKAMMLPITLTGDFNANPDEITIEEVDNYSDFPITDVTKDIPVTFHGFGVTNRPIRDKIDYIYTNGKVIKEASIWDKEKDWYLSDHYPVAVVLDL